MDIVGDTFITDCKIPSTTVYSKFNDLSSINIPDIEKTEIGIYTKNCGLENCHCSFGNDEYLYHLLKYYNCILSEETYYIIRYHSLYSWHTNRAYNILKLIKIKKCSIELNYLINTIFIQKKILNLIFIL